jgi:hypothetical protein
VRVFTDRSYSLTLPGYEGVVTEVPQRDSHYGMLCRCMRVNDIAVCAQDLKIIGLPESAQSPMKKLSILARKLLDADVRALIEVGWLTEELDITEEGIKQVAADILLDNKEAFAKDARRELKEAKKCED